jgi:hypothetical protein
LFRVRPIGIKQQPSRGKNAKVFDKSMQYATLPRRIRNKRIAETLVDRQGIRAAYVIAHWFYIYSSVAFRPGSFKNVNEGAVPGTRLIEELQVFNVRK